MNLNTAKVIILFLCSIVAISSKATTWGGTQVNDPIKEGETCDVYQPASYGSYIYHWSSKYDQVFWPLTDEHGIWFCNKSGFTAFIGDFEGISENEKYDITKYLQKNYKGKGDIESKLVLIEGIYSLRNTDHSFKNKLLRVLSRWYQNLGQIEKANDYRRKAFVDIKVKLRTKLPEGQKLEYLYLAANYSRLFGEIDESDKYIKQLITATKNLEDKKLKGFSEYLTKLANETKYIQPGGRLHPEK
ncbi:conserved hypothetical protein, secreted [Candidatus Thiomargarita nelsonii]|uniref:Secreted protein n=1 Tax=Candidatus Thiomargarita nelsonii TaxID=1003181 RepID=A0A176S5X7_9GAMM|nr:conserved hypothetical protein, secreted [Candidatus Thiomargarita nelsonii]